MKKVRWVKHTVRFVFVTVGIVVLTSFTIDATDSLRNSQTALGILAKNLAEGNCPDGMAKMEMGERRYCIDMYENSVGNDCAFQTPTSVIDTKNNIATQVCSSESQSEHIPWTFVTYHQAKELCAKRGMRLPSGNEWYEAALGTPVSTESCNVDGVLAEAGEYACVSSYGVHDMIGNVWEWVDEEVVDGVYHNRALPEEGYVREADTDGIALVTDPNPQELYDADYFWHKQTGTYALLRGGFHGSGEDAGVYATHAETAPSFASAAIGFRCVVDL